MKLILTHDDATRLRRAMQETEADIDFHYSGRGMFGDRCVGVVASDTEDVTRFTQELARIAITHGMVPLDLDKAVSALGEPSRDSMGTRTVHYWTAVTSGFPYDPDLDD